MQPVQDRQFIVVVRRNGLGPPIYPIVRYPDGRIEQTTWAEYVASRQSNDN